MKTYDPARELWLDLPRVLHYQCGEEQPICRTSTIGRCGSSRCEEARRVRLASPALRFGMLAGGELEVLKLRRLYVETGVFSDRARHDGEWKPLKLRFFDPGLGIAYHFGPE